MSGLINTTLGIVKGGKRGLFRIVLRPLPACWFEEFSRIITYHHDH